MWTCSRLEYNGRVYIYNIKHFEEPSIYGYNEGRASKIWIQRDGIEVFKDTLNNSPEIRIKRMENGISIKNQTKASKQEGNHGLFPLKRA